MPGAKAPVFFEELVLQLLAEHLSFEQGASSDLVLLGKLRLTQRPKIGISVTLATLVIFF